jgi:hypothetical protein
MWFAYRNKEQSYYCEIIEVLSRDFSERYESAKQTEFVDSEKIIFYISIFSDAMWKDRTDLFNLTNINENQKEWFENTLKEAQCLLFYALEKNRELPLGWNIPTDRPEAILKQIYRDIYELAGYKKEDLTPLVEARFQEDMAAIKTALPRKKLVFLDGGELLISPLSALTLFVSTMLATDLYYDNVHSRNVHDSFVGSEAGILVFESQSKDSFDKAVVKIPQHILSSHYVRKDQADVEFVPTETEFSISLFENGKIISTRDINQEIDVQLQRIDPKKPILLCIFEHGSYSLTEPFRSKIDLASKKSLENYCASVYGRNQLIVCNGADELLLQYYGRKFKQKFKSELSEGAINLHVAVDGHHGGQSRLQPGEASEADVENDRWVVTKKIRLLDVDLTEIITSFGIYCKGVPMFASGCNIDPRIAQNFKHVFIPKPLELSRILAQWYILPFPHLERLAEGYSLIKEMRNMSLKPDAAAIPKHLNGHLFTPSNWADYVRDKRPDLLPPDQRKGR